MGRLKYKTRGDANPQGKARVYFSCHEDDFETYFHSISEEILENQNCAIWYDDNFESKHDEEFYEDLKQMQLFVMPITTNLLSTENRALGEEFLFAEENHIPVLPLMQESGLEELFNKKCGTLQFLDKFSSDYTAISYDEKLKKYLSTVLIGDELAEKIRAAFDAYIFMSYRKIDRIHAQKLMRLIHDNEMCRDIAIWYDEMLVPGEEFNDAIKLALQKSDLFVMTVTPNLLEQDNYIMREEYPIAKENGKIIFPAEMVKTDAKRLKENYIDIPKCADTNDNEAFAEALLNVVKQIAMKENEKTPEHNFFIGLAYLYGIDVEVDYVRALDLIKSAAESDVLEAIEQLITMYETGKGVVRNYEKANDYRHKKSEYYYKKYLGVMFLPDSTLAAMYFEKYLNSTVECGDAHLALGEDFHAKIDYDFAKMNYERESQRFDDIAIKKAVGRLEKAKGDLLKSEGNLEEAEEAYKNSIKIIEEIGAAASAMERYSCYISLENVYKAKGDWKSACFWIEKGFQCLEESEQIASETVFCLLEKYYRLGEISRLEGELEKAEELLHKGVNLAKKCNDETLKKNHISAMLMDFYSELGNLYLQKADFTKAEKYRQEGLAMAEEQYEKQKIMINSTRLWEYYIAFATIYWEKHDIKQAKEWCRKSIEVLEKTKCTNGPAGERLYCGSYAMLGNLLDVEGDLLSARRYYEACLRILETNKMFEDMEKMSGQLSVMRERLNEIKKILKEDPLAMATSVKTNFSPVQTMKLALDMEQKGKEQEVLEKWEEAIQYFEQGVVFREELVDDVGSISCYKDLHWVYKKLEQCYEKLEDKDKAFEVKKKSQLIEDILEEELGEI